jgi:hypothetical protein
MIIMAAPTRTAPQRVSNQGLLSRATDSSAIYSAAENNANAQPMVISQPGRVKTREDINLEKFAQLAMYIVALIAIWGGIFSIAFDENATNSNFLMLFIGGLVSAAMAISWIELQSKKNAHQLMEVQNYIALPSIDVHFSSIVIQSKILLCNCWHIMGSTLPNGIRYWKFGP